MSEAHFMSTILPEPLCNAAHGQSWAARWEYFNTQAPGNLYFTRKFTSGQHQWLRIVRMDIVFFMEIVKSWSSNSTVFRWDVSLKGQGCLASIPQSKGEALFSGLPSYSFLMRKSEWKLQFSSSANIQKAQLRTLLPCLLPVLFIRGSDFDVQLMQGWLLRL